MKSEQLLVLDTDIVTLWWHNNPRVVGLIQTIPPAQRCITIITRIEQLQGRFRSIETSASGEELERAQERLTETETWLNRLPTLQIDADAACTFNNLLKARIGKVRRHDLIIAAIVLSRNYTLITRNVKHFRRVPGLKVEDGAR